MHAAFASDAREAHAAKWRSKVAQKPAINPRDSCSQFTGNTMATLQIGSPHRSRQTVLRIIGLGDRFFLRIERRDVAHRPKNLFLHTTCRFGQAGEDRWLDVKA